MPFSHNGLTTTTGIQVFSQVNKYTLSYRFLYENVQGCVFAKNRPVSLNWTDYTISLSLAYWVFCMFLSSADFFKFNFFEKLFQEYISVSNSLDPDQAPVLWVQTVCIGYPQMALVGKELTMYTVNHSEFGFYSLADCR